MATKLKNYFCIALDASSSMGHYRQETIDAFNGAIRTIKEQCAAHNLEAQVSLVVFSNSAKVQMYPTDPRNFGDLSLSDYNPNGQTALFDGTGLAIKTLDSMPDANEANVTHTIIVLTDGEENNSFTFNGMKLIDELTRVQATKRWTVAFQVPPGKKNQLCSLFKIPQDNVREWETTRKGMIETQQVNTSALTRHVGMLAAGSSASTTFYANVNTDLSKVSTKAVKTKLDDLSGDFKSYTVGKETNIKDFVENKLGKDKYVIGSSFYQLMKSEKVQPSKGVLLQEKGKMAIWGGDQARELIGLPIDNKTHAKVVPGNHSNYDVYIESRSVNRILPRGTKVLVNTKTKVNKVPTWDHTALAAK